jgi:hypothetical protein
MGALVGSGDVIKELKRVFGDPKSTAYATAQTKKDLFEGIGVGVGNWQALVAAYKAAGVTVSSAWETIYLQKLSPENVYAIAQARFDGLTRGVAMKVKTHPPGGADKVDVSHEADGSIMIDSPYS